jgi:hypothetical protein
MDRLSKLASGLLALAGLSAGCSFPGVTFGEVASDGGVRHAPGLDVDIPDAGAGDDGADLSLDAGGPLDATATLDAGSPETASGTDAGCDFNGTWATRVTIDVTWQPQGLMSVILQPGSGTITQWAKAVRVQNMETPLTLIDEASVCGISLPDFQATTLGQNDVYGVRFPDSLFDDGYVPPFTVYGSLNAQRTTYNSTSTAVLLGLTMANPATDPWPSTITTEEDQDSDGNPGVTIAVAQGPLANPTATASSYSYIPTDIPPLLVPPDLASQLYVAIRQVTVTSGNVVDCDTMTGTVSIPTIASKPAIDSHIIGCALVDGGSCTTGPSSEAAFVDNSQPVFTPTGTTSFQAVRLPANATCADVRTAFQ